MNADTAVASDVIGLTRVAPVSRCVFMSATAAVAAGYTLAAGPVRAEIITTDTKGLEAGDIKIFCGWLVLPDGIELFLILFHIDSIIFFGPAICFCVALLGGAFNSISRVNRDAIAFLSAARPPPA